MFRDFLSEPQEYRRVTPQQSREIQNLLLVSVVSGGMLMPEVFGTPKGSVTVESLGQGLNKQQWDGDHRT